MRLLHHVSTDRTTPLFVPQAERIRPAMPYNTLTCSQCAAPPEQMMDARHDTLVCMVCGWIMPAEGCPPAPDDLLASRQEPT